MSKSYNLGKKSDMKRFEKDLIKGVEKVASDAIRQNGIDIDCPFCHHSFTAQVGPNTCPHCHNQIDLTL